MKKNDVLRQLFNVKIHSCPLYFGISSPAFKLISANCKYCAHNILHAATGNPYIYSDRILFSLKTDIAAAWGHTTQVYAIGKGADVRGVVASLNATRLSGDVEAEGGARAGQARPAAAALPAAGGEAPAPSAATRCAPPATDWSAFMDAEEAGAPPSFRPALGEDEDEEDAQYVTCLPERRAKRSKPSPAEVGCRAGRENRQPRWQSGEQPGRERYDAPCRQRPGPSATDRPMAAQPFMQALPGGNPSSRAAPAPDRMPQNGGPRWVPCTSADFCLLDNVPLWPPVRYLNCCEYGNVQLHTWPPPPVSLLTNTTGSRRHVVVVATRLQGAPAPTMEGPLT